MEVTSSPILVFQAGAQSTQAERFSPNVWILFPGRVSIALLRSIVVIVIPEPFVARNISGLWRLLKSRIVRACATSKPVLGRNLRNCAAWARADPWQNQHWPMQTSCAIGAYGLIWRLS